MLASVSKLLPPITRFLHQTAPSVIATLIAAGLISGYNRAFSTHLQQPRMAALHAEADTAPVAEAAPAPAVSTVAKPKPIPAAEYFAMRENATEPARMRGALEKDAKAEAGKDQSPTKIAAVTPAPQLPPRPIALPRPEPRVVSVPVPAPARVAPGARVMAEPVAPAELPAPVVAAPTVQPQPVIVAAPPPVIMAAPPPVIMAAPQPPVAAAQPMVTVPDRPGTRPVYATEEPPPPAPPQGPFGVIVNTLRPSSLFARAREFGDKIEAAGNDILPSIRQ